MVFLPPHDGPLQCVDDNLGFAKDRTVSRLSEMQVTDCCEMTD